MMKKSLLILDQICSWPCEVARFYGYWPFTVSKSSRKIEFYWLSSGATISILQLTIYVVCTISMSVNRNRLFIGLKNKSSTEELGYTVDSYINSFSVIFLTILNLKYNKNITALWDHINSLTERILNLSSSSAGKEDDMNLNGQFVVSRLKVLSKYLTVSVIIVATLQALIFCARLATSANPVSYYGGNSASILMAVIPTMVWSVQSCFHAIFSSILIMLIFLFGMLYTTLTMQLKVSQSRRLDYSNHFCDTSNINSGVTLIDIDKYYDHQEIPAVTEIKVDQLFEPCYGNYYRNYVVGRDEFMDKKTGTGEGSNHKSFITTLKLAEELEDVIEEFNWELKHHLLTIFVNLGVPMILSIFFAVVSFEKREFSVLNLGIFLAIVLHFVLFYYFCTRGTSLTFEAQNFGTALGSSVPANSPPELILKVQLFSTKLIINPPCISPGHYFVVNNGLMTSLIAVMSTYLVVLIQFDDDGCRCS